MDPIAVALFGAGAVLGLWSLWERRGRSPRSRAWTDSFNRRHSLVGRPAASLMLVGVALVISAGLPVAFAAMGLLLSCLGAAGLLLWWVLPLPLPRFLVPAWSRHSPGSPRLGRRSDFCTGGRQ